MPILTGVVASATRQGLATDTGAYFPLQVVTVGSAGASSITFSNIPNTYTHLQMRMIARTTRTAAPVDNISIQFNGDTGSNYYKAHYIAGSPASGGSGVIYDAEGTGTYTKAFRFTTDNSQVTSPYMFGVAIVDILDANSTNKNKTIRCFGGVEDNSSNVQCGEVWFSSGMWFPASPAAITSIVLASETGSTIKQFSQFALYGIKAAS